MGADDEAQASVTGTDGSVCAPPCDDSGSCPTDAPAGVTAQPTCALSDSSSGAKYCHCSVSQTTCAMQLEVLSVLIRNKELLASACILLHPTFSQCTWIWNLQFLSELW